MNKVVSIGVSEQEPVDIWLLPESLPQGVAMEPSRFAGDRFWTFDANSVQLLPMPPTLVGDALATYRPLAVLGFNHMNWFLQNQQHVPAPWQPFKVYFLHDKFLRAPWTGFVYAMQHKEKLGWMSSEERLDTRPPKDVGRFIMMR